MSEEGFLSRWSRRKRAIEAGREVAEPRERPDQPGPPSPEAGENGAPAVVAARVEPPAGSGPGSIVVPPSGGQALDPQAGLARPPAGTPREARPGDDTPADPPFDLASLPSIDSLTAATDIRAFLRKEVPEALKRAALRRAWSVDPAIRDFVGPADYAWDYNAPDGVPGASLDLVGDVQEMLAQVFGPDSPAEDAPAVAESDAASTPEAPDAADAPAATLAEAPATATETPDPPGVSAEAPAAPPRRHGSALPS